MKTLLVIDMQNDFIDGALGTKEAELIVPKVAEKIKQYREAGHRVVFTRDTHGPGYLSTQEGRNLPVEHCFKDTPGWEISPKLSVLPGDVIFDKPAFGRVWTGEGDLLGDEVEIIGLCTDICVISNALGIKAAFPELPVTVDASCCAGVSPDSHRTALKAMKMCQIKVVGE